ncbi:MAG: InlB B-repeat-containing protein [Atopobiaceae bacterium]
MKHQPERGQRILAFLLAGTLAWSQVPVSALAETQDTAQQTETEEAAAAASTETEGTSAASDMSSSASSVASEKSASSGTTAEESAPGSAASEAQDSASTTGTDQSTDQGTDKSTTEELSTAAATTTAAADTASSDAEELSVKIRVIGPDAEGNDCDWLAEKTVKVKSGTTAADLTQDQFAGTLTADIQASSWGAYLNTITSPFDGKAYGYDATSGKYWQLFVNGAASESGMSQVTLQEGTEIVWYYSAYGASVTGAKVVEDPSLETPDASATRTEGTAEWAGFNQGMAGGAVTADTPASASETALAWNPVKIGMGASDPVLVDGKLYMVSGGTLQVIDSSTGAVLATKKISTKSGYFCRPVYAEGLLIVPLDDGRLMAYTLYSSDSADSLKLVWETPRIAANGATQTLSSLTVAGGRVFAAFSVVDWKNPLNGTGYIVSASLKDGSSWQVTSENDEYYWSGAAVHGSDIVIADEKGYAYLLNGADGSEISSVSLGSSSHASITKVSDSEYLAVTTDGVLHVLNVSDTAISETGSVKFCDRSTSTAVVSNGIAFVGGSTGTSWPYEGTLSAIDLSRIGEAGYVPQTVDVGNGAVQSTPLVVAGSSKTSIYVTTNSNPGGLSLVSYENGTLSAAQTVFTPGDATYQNYCTASPIASKSGLIFYTNDSGYLFALKNVLAGTESWTLSFDSNGGSSIDSKSVVSGMAAGNVDEPTRDGYTFAGWYLDPEFKNAFDAAATYVRPSGSTTTLYAKWIENTPAPEPGTDDNSGNGTDQNGGGTVPAGTDEKGDGAGNTNGTAPETRSARTATTSSAGTVQTAGESGSTDAGLPAETASVTSAPAQSGSTGSQSSSSKSSEESSEAAADLAGSSTAGVAWNIVVPVVLLVLGLFLILFALKRRKQEK